MRARGSRNVVALLGLRGSGKTTVGRLLARELGRAFVDLDQELVEVARHAGMRADSPGELLTRSGQPLFRELEATALRRVLEPCPHIVLATGGGVVERVDNRVWLERTARCVYLRVPLARLAERLRADPTLRPPLVGEDPVEELEALRARREPFYLALAECVVECGDDPPPLVVQRVRGCLEQGGS